MSEPWERVAVAAGRAYASNMELMMSETGERCRTDPPSDVGAFCSLGENGKVLCRFTRADGEPCRSRVFGGEDVKRHFTYFHPTSKHRLVCVVCNSYVSCGNLKRHVASQHSNTFTATVMERGPLEDGGWKTIYLREVRAALERDGEEEDVEGEVAKVFGRGEWEQVPMGFETWLAMARGEKEDEEDTIVFEMLGDGKVRCRCRLVDGRVCTRQGFAPGRVAQDFSKCHPRSVFRLNCVVCKEDVSPKTNNLKRRMLQSHSDVFGRGCDWQRVFASLVRSELEERNASESVIVRELQLLRESERVPSSFAGWLSRAQKEEGSGCGVVDLDASFERLSNGRAKCRMVRPATGQVCDFAPFTKGCVGDHFSRYHVLSVYRTRCAICSLSALDAGKLRDHLRTRHSSEFTSTVLASNWKSVYSGCVRSAMLREGKSESAIEREMSIVYEHEKVPKDFQKWAVQKQCICFLIPSTPYGVLRTE